MLHVPSQSIFVSNATAQVSRNTLYKTQELCIAHLMSAITEEAVLHWIGKAAHHARYHQRFSSGSSGHHLWHHLLPKDLSLEMHRIEPGTFCLSSRCSAVETYYGFSFDNYIQPSKIAMGTEKSSIETETSLAMWQLGKTYNNKSGSSRYHELTVVHPSSNMEIVLTRQCMWTACNTGKYYKNVHRISIDYY